MPKSESGNGNSTITLNYRTYDPSPYAGINYYRLKQTDFDGKYKYSNVIQITLAKKSFASVYPNPASNTLLINISEDYNDANIKIIDPVGRDILSQTVNSSNITYINTTSLLSGIYYVVIDNGNDLSRTKIIVQH